MTRAARDEVGRDVSTAGERRAGADGAAGAACGVEASGAITPSDSVTGAGAF
jgi:hypothetical protein